MEHFDGDWISVSGLNGSGNGNVLRKVECRTDGREYECSCSLYR